MGRIAKGESMDEVRTVDDMSFKEASDELEGIVRALEQGDLELERSLELYGRGVELLKSLKSRLVEAEQRVQVLVDASKEAQPAPMQAVPQAAPTSAEVPF